jgi:hypothetical protein
LLRAAGTANPWKWGPRKRGRGAMRDVLTRRPRAQNHESRRRRPADRGAACGPGPQQPGVFMPPTSRRCVPGR